MIRVHLTAQDLGRTVARSTPAVTFELAAAARLMRAGTRLDAELGYILATPPDRLKADLAAGRLPARVESLASGDHDALLRLGAAITAFHNVAVEPSWAEAISLAHADRAARGHMLLEAGIDQVLRTLSPFLRWEAGVLSFDCGLKLDVSIWPGGRGIMLVPSYFAVHPAVLDVSDSPVVVTYPMSMPQQEPRPAQPLADLIGRTRAAVLSSIEPGRTTTQVAEHVGISPASASQHASVLRSAGLVSTRRVGQAVLHALTPLGRRLIDLNR